MALEAAHYAGDDGTTFVEMGRLELWFIRMSDTETHFVIRRTLMLGQETLMEGKLVNDEPPRLQFWRRGWESQLFLASEVPMQPFQEPRAGARFAH